ncbi:hypothetical protein GA0061098_1008240 [Bradyrhizobium shewense]|uniref:Uncharacterized protein n=1 Tax=Bradyrhizobium shewense TaxID=1761772 RepID=A0A1C3WML0_9BRAD|nr:hypothetical protein GA0061098_1008240 [Bradyrhizobium shewense]
MVDVVLLLPLLLAVLLILLVIAFVMCVLGIVGIRLLISVYKHFGDGHVVNLILRGLAGVALVTTGRASLRYWRLDSTPPSDGSAIMHGCIIGCSSRIGRSLKSDKDALSSGAAQPPPREQSCCAYPTIPAATWPRRRSRPSSVSAQAAATSTPLIAKCLRKKS